MHKESLGQGLKCKSKSTSFAGLCARAVLWKWQSFLFPMRKRTQDSTEATMQNTTSVRSLLFIASCNCRKLGLFQVSISRLQTSGHSHNALNFLGDLVSARYQFCLSVVKPRKRIPRHNPLFHVSLHLSMALRRAFSRGSPYHRVNLLLYSPNPVPSSILQNSSHKFQLIVAYESNFYLVSK